jgi:hypothetical protein
MDAGAEGDALLEGGWPSMMGSRMESEGGDAGAHWAFVGWSAACPVFEDVRENSVLVRWPAICETLRRPAGDNAGCVYRLSADGGRNEVPTSS